MQPKAKRWCCKQCACQMMLHWKSSKEDDSLIFSIIHSLRSQVSRPVPQASPVHTGFKATGNRLPTEHPAEKNLVQLGYFIGFLHDVGETLSHFLSPFIDSTALFWSNLFSFFFLLFFSGVGDGGFNFTIFFFTFPCHFRLRFTFLLQVLLCFDYHLWNQSGFFKQILVEWKV